MPGLMARNCDMVRLAPFQMVGQLSPCMTRYQLVQLMVVADDLGSTHRRAPAVRAAPQLIAGFSFWTASAVVVYVLASEAQVSPRATTTDWPHRVAEVLVLTEVCLVQICCELKNLELERPGFSVVMAVVEVLSLAASVERVSNLPMVVEVVQTVVTLLAAAAAVMVRVTPGGM
eukprot:TRINITY_DN2031_c0_g6_i1.p2 TRINITY_DN2031_c0_g6~~TRINITY_DN2031_c0_g6_i1.p2  ORF type:complete len:174 (+),score=14.17 TRINITY_DN2031_c0_g6_i1:1222-1743(+)